MPASPKLAALKPRTPVAPEKPSILRSALSPVVAATIVGTAVLSVYLLRTAWTGDDAYISYRVVDNFLHGYGLTWNIGERVQVYTDPLFVFLVTAATAISGNVYLSGLAVSFILTLAAYLLIIRGGDDVSILTASTILLFSKGFMDYSVSGLENPATHLAIAAYLYVYWRGRDPQRLTWITSLAALNRMDAILLFVPSLAAVYIAHGRTVWKRVLIAWSPLALWCAFSLFYYGFLFPNTAYAKLHTGIPQSELFHQGIAYFMNALESDTVTMLAIGIGLLVAFYVREWWLAAGVLLYGLYVLRVGGDFMSARFYTAPLFICVGVLVRYWRPRVSLALAVLAIFIAVGFSIPSPTVQSVSAQFGQPWPVDAAGIADERAYYFQWTSLVRYRHDVAWPEGPYAQAGRDMLKRRDKVVVFPNIGMAGFEAGPDIHIIDSLALGDALIARLPVSGQWRVGHYGREIPGGYVDTVRTGQNVLYDMNIREYYDHLKPIISGPLFSANRFKEIIFMNLGFYDHLLPSRKPTP